MRRGIHLPLIDPEPSPTGPLKVCRQRTITVSPEAGAKGIESAGSRRVRGIAASRHRGIAAQTILLAFQLAHANRRKIKKWLDTLSLGGERPRRRTHHRRPKKEPRSWTPTGHLAPAA